MPVSTLRRMAIPLLALLLTSASLFGATITDRFERRWEAAPGGTLMLSNENGSVDVSSWDREEVLVRAEIRMKAGSQSAAEEAMREFRIDASREGDTIRITTKKPREHGGFLGWLAGRDVGLNVQYVVTVPASFDVHVETVNGSIQARSLSGTMSFETINGRIEVDQAIGSVSADTVNGGIDVELVEGAGGGNMTFSTTNGGIELALPRTMGADIDLATTNGKVSTDIPLTTDSFSRSKVRGTLNGGGVPIKARTVNGSIRIIAGS